MREHNRQKQVVFILAGGLVLTLLAFLTSFACAWMGMRNVIAINAFVYLVEFGGYCLALYLYRLNVSSVMWFLQGFIMLLLLTLFKIVLSVFTSYFLIVTNDSIYYFNNGAALFMGLLGSYVRGILFELPLMAIAARIFETDIFQKNQDRDSRVIDDPLK